MRSGYISGVSLTAILFLLLPFGGAIDPITDTATIEPLQFQGWPLIGAGDGETIEISIESDIPVNIYIVPMKTAYEEWSTWEIDEIQNKTDTEDTYEGVTSQDITKAYSNEDYYVAVVFNPSLEDTAHVTIEYEFILGSAEEAVEDSICGSAMLMGSLISVSLIAIIVIIKRS